MITSSIIAYGDRLGAQMTTLASLVYIAKENNQELCFYDEFRDFRRGYLFFQVFALANSVRISYTDKLCVFGMMCEKKDVGVREGNMIDSMRGGGIKVVRRFLLPVPEMYCRQFKEEKSVANYKRIYKQRFLNLLDRMFYGVCRLFYPDFHILRGKNDVHCEDSFLYLDSKKNYDILSGFGTFQDWKKYSDEILDLYTFKEEIYREAKCIYEEIKGRKPTVSVHFRKGDYLILSSLNLSLDYYQTALTHFEKEKYRFIIFSDDIESCKDTGMFDECEVYYIAPHSAGVDMCLMSLCDNNIIANSSFSFWGAFLNKNKEKKVICPHDFIGESSPENMYINGNWYPDNWIAI